MNGSVGTTQAEHDARHPGLICSRCPVEVTHRQQLRLTPRGRVVKALAEFVAWGMMIGGFLALFAIVIFKWFGLI